MGTHPSSSSRKPLFLLLPFRRCQISVVVVVGAQKGFKKKREREKRGPFKCSHVPTLASILLLLLLLQYVVQKSPSRRKKGCRKVEG